MKLATKMVQHSFGTAGLLAMAALLAGCASSDFPRQSNATGLSQPPAPQIAPVQTAAVQTSDLPPIPGTTASPTITPATPNDTFAANTSASADGTSQTNADGSFVTLDSVGTPGNTTGGRDLSGSLSIEQLLGGWTVMAGADQCRLNLTYTTRGSTGRYRASTPGCTVPTLSNVVAWQLLGNQIQLYDESDAIIGTLLRSGDRFVGTLSGGQAISMVG